MAEKLVPGGFLGPSLLGGNSRGTPAGISPLDEAIGRATTLNAPGEEILYEWAVDLSAVSIGTPLTPSLDCIASALAPSNGTLKLYIGSTTPGDTVGGTVRLLVVLVGPEQPVSVTGAAFLNPGGLVFVQLTGINDTAGTNVTTIRGLTILFA